MKNTEQRPELSFDGFGINGPDEYRTRLATFTKGVGLGYEPIIDDWVSKYGPMMAAAPEMLEALKDALVWMDPDCKLDGETINDDRSDRENVIIAMYQAINKAEGHESH